MKKPRRRATTIIEIVSALVVLGVALPPLMSTFVEASMQTIHPSQSTVAAFLAMDRMEEIIARRHQDTGGYTAVIQANFPNESPVAGFTGFDRTVAIAFVDASLNPVGSDQGYKQVTVTVAWNGGARSIVLEHVFADY